MVDILLALVLGAFLAANVSFVYRLFSIQALFEGVIKGLQLGDDWKKGKKK